MAETKFIDMPRAIRDAALILKQGLSDFRGSITFHLTPTIDDVKIEINSRETVKSNTK